MATDAISRRYSLLNKQLQQSENRNLQTEQDALSRRFASIGGLGSGASIKAGQIANQASARRVQEGKTALAASEADERFKQEEIEKGRAFQTSERLGSQDFASGQAGEQRKFMTGERLGGQEFAAGQAGEQRKFMTGERLGSQEFASGERQASQLFASGEREASQKFAAGESALSRRLQEAGLMGYMTDGSGNKIETQAAKDARLGREQQGSQFDRQLAQQGEQFAKDLSFREKTSLSDVDLKTKAFEADRDYKNANLEWEKFVFDKEFPINEKIAFQNLETAKDAAKNGGISGDLGNLWNIFTRDPIVKTGDWLSDRLGVKI